MWVDVDNVVPGCLYYNPACACYMLFVRLEAQADKEAFEGVLTSDGRWLAPSWFNSYKRDDLWGNQQLYVMPVDNPVLLQLFLTLLAKTKDYLGRRSLCSQSLATSSVPCVVQAYTEFKEGFDNLSCSKSRNIQPITSKQNANACKKCSALLSKHTMRGSIVSQSDRLISQTMHGMFIVFNYAGVPATLINRTPTALVYNTPFGQVVIGTEEIRGTLFYRHSVNDNVPPTPLLKNMMDMLKIESIPNFYHKGVYKSTVDDELILVEGLTVYTGNQYLLAKVNKVLRYMKEAKNGLS